jgi:hypothetical protein
MLNYIYIYGLTMKKNILLNISINILYNICGFKNNLLLNTTINIFNMYNYNNKFYYIL